MFGKPFIPQVGGSYLNQFGIDDSNIDEELNTDEESKVEDEPSPKEIAKEHQTLAPTPNGLVKSKVEIEGAKSVGTKRKRQSKTDEPAKCTRVEDEDNQCDYVKKCLSSQLLNIEAQSKSTLPECIQIGKEYKIGKDIFISQTNLYKIELSDYTLITDAPFDCTYAPAELKPLLKTKWVYKLHVDQTLSSIITRSILRDRVNGGQILAYRYTECSIAGNNCVYYGFIPTIKKGFKDSHQTCYVASTSIWPRKLYLYLKRGYACNCSKDCSMWTSHMDDYATVQSFCIKKIKWNNLYVMMGDFDEKCLEQPKAIRSCEVCAQCFDCSKSAKYCRKHRVCKHKTAKPLESVLSIINTTMKECKLFKI